MIVELAGCILKNKQGKILLLHRSTATRQQWEIPGGKLEPSETPHDAAIREIKEELGIIVKIEKLVAKKDFMQDDKSYSYTWFQARVILGDPKVMEPDIFDDMTYFSLNEMHKISLSSGVKTLVAVLNEHLV